MDNRAIQRSTVRIYPPASILDKLLLDLSHLGKHPKRRESLSIRWVYPVYTYHIHHVPDISELLIQKVSSGNAAHASPLSLSLY